MKELEENLKKDGYPSVMTMTRSNLAIIIEKYNRKVLEELKPFIELCKTITDFPNEDLKSWIDCGKPVEITIPAKVFEQALSAINIIKSLKQ